MDNQLLSSFKEVERKVCTPSQKLSPAAEKELWDLFRSGSNSAFITIYKRYFDVLYSYGYRINNSEDLVKDAIQDVFLDLKKNYKSLGETSSIKFYLFKCLKRRIYKELKTWTNLKEDLIPNESFEITFSHEQTLIDKQIDLEKTQLVNAALKRLSPRKREAIYYIYFEGLTYLQVSELMGLSDSKSARDLVYKALKSLRDSLGFLPLFFTALLP
ncbi:sigma-70 family RNA polymerase sigma factor [uncultured Algoriphagus sp.]|uniref:RNA polymerase sigma factor n=1 Tax=uncultured Algoriphagus sp. TaxID=417365 RepID=UPI0030EB260F